MIVTGIVVLIIVLFIFTLFIIPIKIIFNYSREDKKDKFNITLNILWGLIKLNITEPDFIYKNKFFAPIIKIRAKLGHPKSDDKIKEKEEVVYKFQLNDLADIYGTVSFIIKEFDNPIRYIIGSTTVYEFTWITRYGFKDAAYTGIAYGFFWSIKGIIYNMLQGKVKKVVGKPQFKVLPEFNDQLFATRISCIFALRLGHIIIAALKILVRRIFKRG